MVCSEADRAYILGSLERSGGLENAIRHIDARRFEHVVFWVASRIIFHDPDVGFYLPDSIRECMFDVIIESLRGIFRSAGENGFVVPRFGFYEVVFGSQSDWFFSVWKNYMSYGGSRPMEDSWKDGRIGYHLAKFYGFRLVKKDPGLTYLRGIRRFSWGRRSSLYMVYFPDVGEAYAVYVNPSYTSRFKRFVESKGGRYERFDADSYWSVFRSPQWAFVVPITAFSLSRDLDSPVFFRYGGYFGRGVYAAWEPFTDPVFLYSLRVDLNYQYFFFRHMRTYFRKFGLRRKIRPLRWLLYEAGGLYEVLTPPDA